MVRASALNLSINSFPAISLRDPLVRIMDLMEVEAPAVRYLAPLSVPVLMAEVLNRDVHDDVIKVKRMLREAESTGFNEQVRAMRDLVAGEIKGKL
jgi:hypothetical protein